ncbi:DNA topoisomerase VI subunit B [Candidatus Micrarchaeota archaeon]|nr:DNA topoisomerase VI subunit B [Candidatus Micrarchaeota archaeon]
MKNDDQFSDFKEHSVAEFFKKNRQMLGFSGKVRSLTTIVHEYVTNSLDAAEEAKILCDVTIKLEELDKETGHYKITAEDNGSGIPENLMGKALGQMLAGTKFHRYIQQRGQQGIGAAGVTMYSQITTGKTTKVTSGYRGKIIEAKLNIDFKTNKANVEILSKEEGDWHGLIIETEVKDVKYDKSVSGVYEYLKRTAIANPHTQITFIDPNNEVHIFPRSIEKIPPKPEEVKPHPLGMATNDLMDFAHRDVNKTLNQFFFETFSRMSNSKVKELRELLPHINFKKDPKKLEWSEADDIIRAFQKIKWIAPSVDGIYPIGEEQIRTSMINILEPEFLAVIERKPKIYRGGIPFIVEVGLGYGGNSGRNSSGDVSSSDVMRFGNRAPLLFDAGGCAINESVKSVDWKRYGLKSMKDAPITLMINISSVHIPYTGAGKQAIAMEQEIVDEVRFGIMEAARKMQAHIQSVVKTKERIHKKKAILRYIHQVSEDLSYLSNIASFEIENLLSKLIEEKYDTKKDEKELEEAMQNGGITNGEN